MLRPHQTVTPWLIRGGHHCLSAVRMLRRSPSPPQRSGRPKSPLPFGGSHAATHFGMRPNSPGKVTTAFRRFACCDASPIDPSVFFTQSPLPFGGSHAATQMFYGGASPGGLSPLPFGGSHAATNDAMGAMEALMVTTAFRRFACCGRGRRERYGRGTRRSPLPFGGSHAATQAAGLPRVITYASPLPFGGSHAATRPSDTPSGRTRNWSPLPFGGSHAATNGASPIRQGCTSHHCLSAVRMLRHSWWDMLNFVTATSPLPFGGSHAATTQVKLALEGPRGSPLPFGGSHAATLGAKVE